MLNTPEKRRQLVLVIIILIALHLFMSERLIRRDQFPLENQQAAGQMFDQYQHILDVK